MSVPLCVDARAAIVSFQSRYTTQTKMDAGLINVLAKPHTKQQKRKQKSKTTSEKRHLTIETSLSFISLLFVHFTLFLVSFARFK